MIGFLEIVFADDLNCFKDCGLNATHESMHAEMHQCHQDLLKWGKTNQVSFDPANKSKHLLAFNGSDGCNVKL